MAVKVYVERAEPLCFFLKLCPALILRWVMHDTSCTKMHELSLKVPSMHQTKFFVLRSPSVRMRILMDL